MCCEDKHSQRISKNVWNQQICANYVYAFLLKIHLFPVSWYITNPNKMQHVFRGIPSNLTNTLHEVWSLPIWVTYTDLSSLPIKGDRYPQKKPANGSLPFAQGPRAKGFGLLFWLPTQSWLSSQSCKRKSQMSKQVTASSSWLKGPGTLRSDKEMAAVITRLSCKLTLPQTKNAGQKQTLPLTGNNCRSFHGATTFYSFGASSIISGVFTCFLVWMFCMVPISCRPFLLGMSCLCTHALKCHKARSSIIIIIHAFLDSFILDPIPSPFLWLEIVGQKNKGSNKLHSNITFHIDANVCSIQGSDFLRNFLVSLEAWWSRNHGETVKHMVPNCMRLIAVPVSTLLTSFGFS